MNKAFIPSEWEEKLYSFWEQKGYFKAQINKDKQPFSIILPPPNANAPLHLGHAMYVYEDIMIRYNKLLGKEVLWLPGADHAGFETQFVFEKNLQKQGKSRFDYDRETLFTMIWDFVMENRPIMESQLKRLGFALDWEKKKFTMDDDIVKIVYETFKKLHDEGLVYRDTKLVNFCTHDGTSFSDLEIIYREETAPLYYMKYGPFELATVRPETKFGDTAVAVHPDDRRYKKWIGKEIEVTGLIETFKIRVIADEAVDPKFGTGVVKVTPAHDFNDYEMAKRHNIPLKQVIGFDGRLNELTGPYKGLKVLAAREKVVEDLKQKGLITKIDESYTHSVPTCYKCGRVIEPLPKEQWFVKVRPLADQAIKLVEKGEINIYPRRFKRGLIDWLKKFHDWNISRQIVWGIRIPAWRCSKCNEWTVTSGEKPTNCLKCQSKELVQDEDTFDTWFSSSQWSYATLLTQDHHSQLSNLNSQFYTYFYPTAVMETGYEILPWWVARMIMMGYFATNKVPFKNVFLHGMVRDKQGRKMSKSKGNVVNPMEVLDKYGADALRAALIFQTTEGGDITFSEDKAVGMRNFANKIWNVGRFLYLNRNGKMKEENGKSKKKLSDLHKEFFQLKKKSIKNMDSYNFSLAFDTLFEFLWHRFADFYIEELKEEVRSGNIKVLEGLEEVYLQVLLMLHPFMPFVTEAVWKEFHGEEKSILDMRIEF
ncbi:valine--tRNA ligase [Candidatus Roizmanbacteria bacterium RIFCSPLOWO2_02_FULL_37_19]|uniref:Valine--tRNA ligase n=1 Tax=Candidatus Roizmanbacteria bacterium RIFCSPHIGHO2_02_FULL_37_24 TaxID=1802037 RepID=A0A1F7GUL6_9BACT|nr:MAG: valine--tRNA ligase [Candidatus Roizmanbacteria bacterium RIFCSPHIGHO2_01_FULL_38_41]OGK22710.1 MAG: valine--tRNA ligase [Candidatus Roizmanbacteria bacterium RIFCSPHIGHO2_02_FULL_37_24]OGK32301.1 MAG: valine--tRNA ligase [Candidatus Roizmanbacteria bacterium RIFCSPHIGHO2_12_FULL_37_23]OGK54303.1 MAG: valine--tRNA ligase [Candidatus Roizmanbacteria bacterium RIFCSPLOWO2_02_FULL_37_19]